MGGALKAIDLVDYVLYMAAMVALPPTPALAGEQWRDAWAERVDRTEPWLLRWLEEQWDGPYWRHGSLRQRDERRRVGRLRADRDPDDDRRGVGRRVPQQQLPHVRAAAGRARAAHRAVGAHEPGELAARAAHRPRPGDDPLLRHVAARLAAGGRARAGARLPAPADRSRAGSRAAPGRVARRRHMAADRRARDRPQRSARVARTCSRCAATSARPRGSPAPVLLPVGPADGPASRRRDVARLRLARARRRARDRGPSPTHRHAAVRRPGRVPRREALQRLPRRDVAARRRAASSTSATGTRRSRPSRWSRASR